VKGLSQSGHRKRGVAGGGVDTEEAGSSILGNK